MFTVQIEPQPVLPMAKRQFEYVERKGVGHPDSICDAVMESISLALSREYLGRVGRILHHNTDKGLLVAGQATPKFGGGTIEAPMRLIVGDRATTVVDGHQIPVDDIVETCARDWFRKHLRFVDPAKHLIIQNELKPGSPELTGIFAKPSAKQVANDTSAVVGFAPLSETERLVLTAEHFLNSHDFKRDFPETGEDVKVMGIRQGRKLLLTVAIAFVDLHVWEASTYFHRKEALKHELDKFLKTKLHELDAIDIQINALDNPDGGLAGIYLTTLGTSAENADGGEVGRGNRVNGLISLCRPMTMEAAAGKNPVSHVGKIYNLLAHEMARKIHASLDSVEEINIWLGSQIGGALNDPYSVSAQLAMVDGVHVSEVTEKVQAIIHQEISDIESFVQRVVNGEFPVC